jgi:Protein of unknown function (DUF1552)
MGKPTMSRRRFLRDLGVSAGAVPLLTGLDTLYAKAQTAVTTVPKKRFIVMYTPNGQLYSSWRVPIDPATAGTTSPFITDITTGPGLAALQSDTTIWGRTVTSTAGAVAPPLSMSASKLLILDRLSMIAGRPIYNDPTAGTLTINGTTVKASSVDGIPHPGGHQKGMGSLLTGQVLKGGDNNFGNAGLGNGISIDQVLANTLFKGKVKFPSLQLAVMGTNDLYGYDDRQVDKEMSYTAPISPIVPVSDPFVLFNTVFGAPSTGTATSGPTPQQLADKSVLDAVQADFMRLQTKLSSADWQLLQQHQSAVRDIETQLTSVFTLSCSTPSAPAAPAGVNITDATATLNWTEVPGMTPVSGKMLMDIMIQAVACGLTNIVTFQWTHSEDNLSFPWLTLPPSQCNLNGVGHHNMSHERDPNLLIVDGWYASQFNYMITQLDGIQESGMPGTTVLDNSLLMYSSCLSDGSAHISDNAYFALAGSNGGYFKSGKLIRFNDVYTPLGVGVDPLSNDWYTKTGAGGGVQTAQQDQGKVGSPDLSNNDLMGSIFDSFGLDMQTVAPTIADSRFFHGNLPGVKIGS